MAYFAQNLSANILPIEPQHNKTNNIAFSAPIKNSDQPGHLPSLSNTQFCKNVSGRVCTYSCDQIPLGQAMNGYLTFIGEGLRR